MKAIKLKKDGTPDLRQFPKAVRDMIKAEQSRKATNEMDLIRQILEKDSITMDDLNRMKQVGTHSVFQVKVNAA
ncbi:hypothetical protein [Puia dinghuensis]|uniref:Uncharacterized protein n=1 Tax=Puia dinghuensis TaxID=1792502 RepID=A0A8J2UF79_9BACT|nr:hypothetical protein [Puia dinghuensis]GGB08058.1 hypothetical protein GCM10011511_34500 [Puia dinghuensis]